MRFWLVFVAVCLANPALAVQPRSWSSAWVDNLAVRFLAAVGKAPIGAVMQTPAPDGGKFYAELIRYHEWMMGFVSGFNAGHEDNVTDQINVDLSALDVWLRKWCNDNPTKSVAHAAVTFRDQMTARR